MSEHQKIKYAGTVDGCAFTYEDGELRVRCKPQYALRMLLEMEPQYCEPAPNFAESLSKHLATALENVAAPGGSADAATRTAAVEPSGKDAEPRPVTANLSADQGHANSAQPPAGATPKPDADVIQMRPVEDPLPENVRQSSTLLPVVRWYLGEHPDWTDARLLQALEAQRPGLKCLRHIKDLAERVRVTADVARNPNPGPKEGS